MLVLCMNKHDTSDAISGVCAQTAFVKFDFDIKFGGQERSGVWQVLLISHLRLCKENN